MSSVNVNDILDLVYRDYAINGKRSLTSIKYHAKHLIRLLPPHPTTNDIESFKLQRVKEKAAPATIRNELSILKTGYRHAVNCELMKPTDAPRIIFPRVDNTREVVPTTDQVLKLIEYMSIVDSDISDLIRWYVITGWRKREPTYLTWDDVSADQSEVCLSAKYTKNRKERRLTLSDTGRELINSRWLKRNGPYVFHRRGRQIKSYTYTWRKIVKAVGMPTMRVHDLRRYFAQTGIDSGIPEVVLMRIGGWLTHSTFKRYAIVDSRMVAKSQEKIAQHVFKTLPLARKVTPDWGNWPSI